MSQRRTPDVDPDGDGGEPSRKRLRTDFTESFDRQNSINQQESSTSTSPSPRSPIDDVYLAQQLSDPQFAFKTPYQLKLQFPDNVITVYEFRSAHEMGEMIHEIHNKLQSMFRPPPPNGPLPKTLYSPFVTASSSSTATPPNPLSKRCSHCHTTTTPCWRKDPATQEPLCNACGLYIQQHRKPRRVPASPPPAPAEWECTHCKTHTTSLWRRAEGSGARLCNACGVYLKSKGRDRPLELRSDEVRGRVRLKRLADMIQPTPQPSFSLPMSPFSVVSAAPYPPPQPPPPSSNQQTHLPYYPPPPSTPTKTCSRCGTSTTPCWRKDPATSAPLCNACGLRKPKKGQLAAMTESHPAPTGPEGYSTFLPPPVHEQSSARNEPMPSRQEGNYPAQGTE